MSDDINELDPLGLDINLREVDTSRPILKDGKYLFTIKEVSKVAKKDDATKHNLMIVLALAQDAETPDGDKVSPGFQVRRYLPLQQSDKEGAPDFKRDLVLFLCAAFGIDAEKEKELIPERYPALAAFVNRQVHATIKAKSDDTGKSNDVGYFSKA